MRISDEGKIGIALALIFAVGTGAAIMVPEQRWIGALIVVIAIIGLIWLGWNHFVIGRVRYPKNRGSKKKMIPLVGMIVCGLGFLGFAGCYFWPAAEYGSTQVGPLMWYFPPGMGLSADSEGRLRVVAVTVAAKNTSENPVEIRDAYLLSEITGEKIYLDTFVDGKTVKLDEVNAIPPNVQINLAKQFNETVGPNTGPLVTDFIKSWSKIRVVSSYGNFTYEHSSDLEPQLRQAMAAQISPPDAPHVSKKIKSLNILQSYAFNL